MPTKKTPLILTPEEAAKVRNCLAILQQAQGMINSAAQELCSVRGFADEWSASNKVYDAIKAYWYKVNSRRQRIKDGEIKIEDELWCRSEFSASAHADGRNRTARSASRGPARSATRSYRARIARPGAA